MHLRPLEESNWPRVVTGVVADLNRQQYCKMIAHVNSNFWSSFCFQSLCDCSKDRLAQGLGLVGWYNSGCFYETQWLTFEGQRTRPHPDAALSKCQCTLEQHCSFFLAEEANFMVIPWQQTPETSQCNLDVWRTKCTQERFQIGFSYNIL